MDETRRQLTCACGWTTSGTIEDVYQAAVAHGRNLHNMEVTREQVAAMSVAEGPDSGGR